MLMLPTIRVSSLSRGSLGTTLVEAVLAVMVLGIALGACVLSFSLAMKAADTSRNQMFALHAARYELECLRINSYNSATLNVGTHQINTNNWSSGYYTNYWGYYIVTNNAYAGVKDVTVGICYRNRLRGGVSTNILTTSLSNTLHP